jgi:predicted nucleic acid-binding protein
MQFRGFRLFVESAGAGGLLSVYIDSSSWNRLYDDHTQDRIRKEANAVKDIINLIKDDQVKLIFSQALQEEMSRHPDIAYGAIKISSEFISRSPEIDSRGLQLHNKGMGAYDALHVASAEEGGADVLLTSDDRMIRKARSLGARVRLENPLEWLKGSGLAKRAAALATVQS